MFTRFHSPYRRSRFIQRRRIILGFIVIFILLLFYSLRSRYFNQPLPPSMYDAPIQQYAAQYQVDPQLIYAIIQVESNFNPQAISHQGATGLMQITEETFHWLNSKLNYTHQYEYSDLLEPIVNIEYGTFFISYLLAEFNSLPESLAAYHAGRGIVNKWLKDSSYSSDGKHLDHIPYPKTSHYVDKVQRFYQRYQQQS